MNKTVSARTLAGVLLTAAILFQNAGPAAAEEGQPAPSPAQQQATQSPAPPQQQGAASAPFTAAVRNKVFLTGNLGYGFDKIDVGKTSGGDTVSISGAGGFGVGVGFGLGLSQGLDLDFELGAQASTLSPATANAKGSFTRSYLLATLKHKIPTSDMGRIKIGFGLGSYNNGELDVDTSDAGGSHTVVTYDRSTGVHVTGEFERFIGPNTSLYAGGKLYFVKYKAGSCTDDGVAIPVSFLNDKVKELNGNGLDIFVGISQYF